MKRGKSFKNLAVVVATVVAASMIAGFNGCGKKAETGGAGPSEANVKPAESKPPTQSAASSEPTLTAAPGKRVVTLYFSDQNAEKLVAEQREIPKTPAIANAIIKELIKGPRDAGLYPTLPRSLKLLGVRMNGGVAVVNLSNVRAQGIGGTAAEMMIVYSIVDSLTELPKVKSVRFLVDGKKRDVLLDAFDITDPVERDPTLIKR